MPLRYYADVQNESIWQLKSVTAGTSGYEKTLCIRGTRMLPVMLQRITGKFLSRCRLQRFLPKRFPTDAAVPAVLLEGEFSTGKKSIVEVPPLGDGNHLNQSGTSIFIESEARIPVLNEAKPMMIPGQVDPAVTGYVTIEGIMTSEERLDRIETIIDKHNQQIDKQNEGIQSLIVVARPVLTSIQEMREVHQKDHERVMAQIDKLREAQTATDEKLHILVDTVDRIIRRDNRHGGA